MEKSPWVDRGTFAGSLAAGAVLALWLFTSLGQGAESGDEPGSGGASAENPAVVDPTSGDSVGSASGANAEKGNQGEAGTAPPISSTKAWEADARWAAALGLGKAGIAQAEAAEEFRIKQGGDPFYYRNQIAEAAKKVTQAVTQLKQLRADFQGDAVAVGEIDRWIAHFEGKTPRNKK